MTIRFTPGMAWPVHGIARTRALEQQAQALLPPHALMQRAGLAIARLAMALAPHARTGWVACGPGNNGGDGLEAAAHLQAWGWDVTVTHLPPTQALPTDAAAALQRAQQAGVRFAAHAPPGLTPQDLAIDALLGIGARPMAPGALANCLAALSRCAAPVLAVDVPSGLNADSGQLAMLSGANPLDSTKADARFHAKNTLTLLTVKPGLLMGEGRDACGTLWFDDLGAALSSHPADARLTRPAPPVAHPHAAHKGTRGDVAVLGGAPGMAGAALLAAIAALHAGAGRVFVALLDGQGPTVDPQQPELMFRSPDALDWQRSTLVCGCGGGEMVRALLPRALATPAALVLDADALNAMASDTALRQLLLARGARQRTTVLTPHPLEAARLLGCSTAQVQSDRLAAAQALAAGLNCVVVLKGSGTVVAAPGQVSLLNPTGNGRLGTAGSGDVLAGWLGARLAQLGPMAHTAQVQQCAAEVVFHHGQLADQWPADQALTAQALARAIAA